MTPDPERLRLLEALYAAARDATQYDDNQAWDNFYGAMDALGKLDDAQAAQREGK